MFPKPCWRVSVLWFLRLTMAHADVFLETFSVNFHRRVYPGHLLGYPERLLGPWAPDVPRWIFHEFWTILPLFSVTLGIQSDLRKRHASFLKNLKKHHRGHQNQGFGPPKNILEVPKIIKKRQNYHHNSDRRFWSTFLWIFYDLGSVLAPFWRPKTIEKSTEKNKKKHDREHFCTPVHPGAPRPG